MKLEEDKTHEFQIPDMADIAHELARHDREREDHERKEREITRTKALAEIAMLPIEERLARIEQWIYDYKPEYVPPPRFR